jgi:effector-binding domain-containing protein
LDYQVCVERVQAGTTAVVCRRASQGELSRIVPQACGEVWAFVRSAGLPHPGRNLALYLDGEINLECGVELAGPFQSDGRVIASRTPAGLVATTAHFGPYDRLGGAHEAIRRWCDENGRQPAGPSWELYGHWDDDPAKLRTDVYYLLRGDVEPANTPGATAT